VPIVDKDGRPTLAFQRYFQSLVEAIEGSIFDLTDAQKRLDEQQTDIERALEQAGIAINSANAVNASTALASSYTDPGGVLSATDAGVITVAAHVRIYGDDTAAVPHRVNVDGGSVSVTPSADPVYVFYVDPTRVGGAVTYQASLNYLDAAQVNDVHSVGVITLPATGEPPQTGGGTYPPGYTPGRPRQPSTPIP
jgi:hypothetical protein